jgi:hypothetical protein
LAIDNWRPNVLTDDVVMAPEVYRVLIDARPVGAQAAAQSPTEHAVVSVAVRADSAAEAEAQAWTMLATRGWMPLGTMARTSNLTRLLQGPSHDAFDSAYGDYARQWLQLVHDEALQEGSAVHLLSVDYEYLDQPKRLDPPEA